MTKQFFLFFSLLYSLDIFSQDSLFTNNLGMEFILVNPGSMVVGKFQPTIGKHPDANATAKEMAIYNLAEKMAKADALPGFKVNMQQSYFLGKFEVTQQQWEQLMNKNPSVFKKNYGSEEFKRKPIENVTWKQAQAFIKKLNQHDPAHQYRLPTEFEWEFAARAGAVDDIPWSQIQRSAVLSGATPSEIGTKKPNAWGFYDMLGNVWEWVQDYYNEKIFPDPLPPSNGKQHVLKGASFTGDVKNATYMTHAAGPGNGFDIGFRVLMETK